MDDWFNKIISHCALTDDIVQELREVGFVVMPGPVASSQLSQLAVAYDAAVAGADVADRRK